MGFKVDNIPYGLNFGLDLESYNLKQEQISNAVFALEANKLDFLINPISLGGHTNTTNSNDIPIFLDDFMLFSYEWKDKFITKVRTEHIMAKQYDLISQDIEYSYHLSARSIIMDMRKDFSTEELYQLIRIMKKFINSYPEKTVNLIIDFDKNGLDKWKRIISMLGYIDNVSVCLRMGADLPEQVIL
jgi:hypothetical protein